MRCEKCGADLRAGENFCPICGAKVQKDVYEGRVVNPNAGEVNSCMIWGIVAAAISGTGIVGLIFAIIAMNKWKTYVANGGMSCGKLTAAKATSIYGLVSSIICLVGYFFLILYFVFIVGLIATGPNLFDMAGNMLYAFLK